MSRKPPIKHVDLDLDDLRRRLAESPLSEDDKTVFGAVVDTLALVTRELEAKRISINRLRRLIFGASTEKLNKLDPKNASADDDDRGDGETSQSDASSDGSGNVASADSTDETRKADAPKSKRKRKGHGRHGAEDYTGAEQRDVPHPSLVHGDCCPTRCGGNVYQMAPLRLVRLHGSAPISAQCTNCGRLRCGLCGEVFTADVPDDVNDEKYDEATMAIVALLKYGSGLPFYRLARLQLAAGVPLPASTQWQLCEKAGKLILPVFCELIHRAAQGGLLHVDDTGAKILGPVRRRDGPVTVASESNEPDAAEIAVQLPVPPARPETRTGTFTTGIVSRVDEHSVVLYFTGWRHAGDNLEHVLSHRGPELELPIQMCDALSRNASGDFETILANCLSHARREFTDLYNEFREPCRYVVQQLAAVYHNDKEAHQLELSPEQRLVWHQVRSGPVMEALKKWMKTEVEELRIEPNSSLGSAINYMTKHWAKLTLFLSVAGAPLDNNLCERILKRAILHRKNSLFFRTQRGAAVADICMSLIQTAELSRKNPLHYLTTLLEHHDRVASSPGDWLPWNYEQTLAELQTVAA